MRLNSERTKFHKLCCKTLKLKVMINFFFTKQCFFLNSYPDKIQIFHATLIMVTSLKKLLCFKSISILSFISFFWNTRHQMFIPAITGRSWLTKTYFTNAALKGGCDSFKNNSSLCWQEAFLCGFYATYAMFL